MIQISPSSPTRPPALWSPASGLVLSAFLAIGAMEAFEGHAATGLLLLLAGAIYVPVRLLRGAARRRWARRSLP